LRTLAGRRFRAELARLETDVAGALDELPETPAETKPVFSNELRAALEAAFQVRRRPDVAVGVDHLLYGLLTHGVSTVGLILRSAGDQLELAL